MKDLRGQLVKHYDQAGINRYLSYSFKGELLAKAQQLRSDYRNEVDWTDIKLVALEDEKFVTSSKFNALGAVIEQFNPDNSIFKPEYHQSGKLNKVKLRLRNEREDKIRNM